MFFNPSSKRHSVERMRFLADNDPRSLKVDAVAKKRERVSYLPRVGLGLLLFQANLPLPLWSFVLISFATALFVAYFVSFVLSPYCVVVYSLMGGSVPYLWVLRRATDRAMAFAVDYPSVLLAAASSIKAGMTPLRALERAIELLPKTSPCRREFAKLTYDLGNGVPRSEAIAMCGRGVRLPELELFRSGFLLVLENGGRFAPTLERLARVTRDRMTLVSSAKSTTASMRITGNVVLAVVPVVMLLMGVRTDDYWTLLLENPISNTVASVGIVVITCGYVTLRKMSAFRP